MDGAVPALIGFVILIALAAFVASIILVRASYRRTFKANKAIIISKLNVLLATVACVFGLLLINTAGGFSILALAVIMLIVSISVVVKVSKRKEKI